MDRGAPRGHGLADVVRWMAGGTGRARRAARKGAIAAGRDADLVAFADTARSPSIPAALHHRHPVTPYAGRTLTGVVRSTWLRGATGPRGPPEGC